MCENRCAAVWRMRTSSIFCVFMILLFGVICVLHVRNLMHCYVANAQINVFSMFFYFVFLCDVCISCSKLNALLCAFFYSEYADHMAALLQRTKRNSFFAARRRESQSQPRKNDARGCSARRRESQSQPRRNDARGCCCNHNDEGSHARGCVTALQFIWA